MHRATALLATLILAGCASQVPQIKPVSLKDDPVKPDTVSAVVVQPPAQTVRITASGGEGLTSLDIELAMAKALRLKGYKIVPDGQAWSIAATIGSLKIHWSITDHTGKPHAVISQAIPKAGEIRGSDAVAAANSAANSVAKIIPPPKGDQL